MVAIVHLTEEQVVEALRAYTPEQRRRLLERAENETTQSTGSPLVRYLERIYERGSLDWSADRAEILKSRDEWDR